MLKHLLRVTAGGLLLLGFCCPVTPWAAGQTVSAVSKLDLSRYMGTWYEVARYPNKPEKQCVSDAIALYALADKPNRFQVVTSCQMKDSNRNTRNANGKMDKRGDGRLKVSRILLFSAKYWVLAVGPEYEWALVGSPNHKSLWVLSRTPVMKPEILAEIEAKAAAQGFDTARLVMVSQRLTRPSMEMTSAEEITLRSTP